MILDVIARKQLIWYSHVERMDPTRLPKIVIHWKHEGRKKRGHPWRTWKDGIYTAIYAGCPRRNVPDFGRVFLMLKYTDITQNTYVQS